MTRTEVEGEVARGDKVILRTKRLEDAEAEFTWRKDPELASYDAIKPISTAYEDFLALYEDDLAQPTPFRHSFAVDDMSERHIGNVMYYNIDLLKREAEVGITIGDRDYWNHGYGADALAALVGYIFKSTPLTRLYLKTLDWNIRAQHSFKKAGFAQYGTSRRSNGTFILMELRRNSWEARDNGEARQSLQS